MLARREYDRLASEATEGGQANAGAAGEEDGHGATANREGTGTEEPPGTMETAEDDGSAGPRHGNLTAPTAPGPSMARLRAASMT